MKQLGLGLIVATLALACGASAQAELVGYWSFDDGTGTTLTDSSGHNGHGTLAGTVSQPTWAAGHTGGAGDHSLSFLPTIDDKYAPGCRDKDPHVLLGDRPQLKTTGDQTISLWVYPTSLNDAHRRNPFQKAYGGEGALTQEPSGYISYYYGSSGAGGGWAGGFASPGPVLQDQWNHVVIVRDLANGEVRKYINGAVAVSPTSKECGAGTWPAYFGRGYEHNYHGRIDDAAIFNDALNPLEVAALAQPQRSLSQLQYCPDDWLKGWACRQAITVSKDVTATDLDGFPVPIQITDASHRVFDSAHANGHDIVFTTADGRSLLPHELETFNTTAGSEELVAWVNTPLSATQDTTIYMYSGGPDLGDLNSTDTWDANHKMVQHLQETSGVHYDSTANGNDATVTGADMNASGRIDGADAFDGSGDYLDLPYGAGIDPSTSPQTFSMWVKPGAPTDGEMVFSSSQSPDANARMYIGHTGGDWEMGIQNSPWGAGTTDVTTDWTHLALVMDGTTATLYVNGVPDHQKSYTSYTLNANIDVGRHPSSPGTYDLTGFMDEIRISDTARTAEWILATYRLVAASEDYFTFDDPVCVPEPATLTLLGLGALALLRRRRRGRQ